MVFGGARGCGDPLAFDFQAPTADGLDYPVVVFNHDFVPHDAWTDRERLQPYRSEVCGSFAEFLRALLTDDPSIFPPPLSPEEKRHQEAWRVVRELLAERNLPAHYRPAGAAADDPEGIARVLREM